MIDAFMGFGRGHAGLAARAAALLPALLPAGSDRAAAQTVPTLAAFDDEGLAGC